MGFKLAIIILIIVGVLVVAGVAYSNYHNLVVNFFN